MLEGGGINMPKLPVYDMLGNQVGEIGLSEEIFGVKPNVHVMHEVVKNYLANKRRGTQSALTRSEVSGGGKKPWRQKGTGHARQGSIRAPQWRHGGIVFAPKPRSYKYSLNKKVKRLAIKSALSAKLTDNEIVIIDSIKMDEYKTKTIIKMLDSINSSSKALIVLPDSDRKVINSIRNIPKVSSTRADSINTYEILNAGKLILSRDSLVKIEEVYA